MDNSRLRVLTCNIYKTTAEWERRRPVLIEEIRRHSPELIALQRSVLTADYDQAEDVLGDYPHVFNSPARLPMAAGEPPSAAAGQSASSTNSTRRCHSEPITGARP